MIHPGIRRADYDTKAAELDVRAQAERSSRPALELIVIDKADQLIRPPLVNPPAFPPQHRAGRLVAAGLIAAAVTVTYMAAVNVTFWTSEVLLSQPRHTPHPLSTLVTGILLGLGTGLSIYLFLGLPQIQKIGRACVTALHRILFIIGPALVYAYFAGRVFTGLFPGSWLIAFGSTFIILRVFQKLSMGSDQR
jgi:hypothetical protein